MAAITSQGSVAYLEQFGAGIRIAQVIGLTSTAFVAGKTFTQSFSAVPALLIAPAPLLAQQWKTMFDTDKVLAPTVALFGTSIFGYLAAKHSGRATVLYGTASALIGLAIPYTFILGEPLNQKLEKKASTLANASITDPAIEAGIAKGETVHELVDLWATINFGRAILATVSTVLATWAAISKIEAVPASVRLATGANRMGN